MKWQPIRRTIKAALLLALSFTFSDTFAAERVLVFGGTGRLGSDISKALHNAGYQVTVFARPASDRSRLEGLSVNFVTGDVLNQDSVARAMHAGPFDVVIDALSRGSAPAVFYADSMANIAQAAAATRVKQVILHGSVGAGDSMIHSSDSFSRGMLNVMQAKTQGEEALLNSGVPYTIVRNWAIKPYGTAPTGNGKLLEDRTSRGWITRADLAALTVECMLKDRCINKTFHAIDDSLDRR